MLVGFTDRKIFLRHGEEIQRFGRMGDIRKKKGILKRDILRTKDPDKIHNLPEKCKPLPHLPDRYLPFNYVITGAPVLSLYGMQIPVSFVIGRQQSSFTQPFNQFELSPSYKWVTVHAGYRNLTFSPYTLTGACHGGGQRGGGACIYVWPWHGSG